MPHRSRSGPMADISALAHVAAAAAAVGAGAVNALAGGGTLISFPVLTAIGVPAVNANATNTVALCPGYVGGTWALRREIDGDRRAAARAGWSSAASAASPARCCCCSRATRRSASIVPFLILLSCLLLAVQDPLRRWVARHRGRRRSQVGRARRDLPRRRLRRLLRCRARDHADRRARAVLRASRSPSSTRSSNRSPRRSTCRRRRSSCSRGRSSGRWSPSWRRPRCSAAALGGRLSRRPAGGEVPLGRRDDRRGHLGRLPGQVTRSARSTASW